ncbi:hypothetical protein GCM10027186_50380 [Micromonospora schwarzwaldensis]
MTEPAAPGGDPIRPGPAPDAAASPGPDPVSPWAAPSHLPPHSTPPSAPAPAAPPHPAAPHSAPPGPWPPAGPYPSGGHGPASAPPHHAGQPGPGSAHPGPFGHGPAYRSGQHGYGAPGAYPGNGPGHGGGWGAPALPPPPREAPRPPKRVDAVPGTPFGVVHLDVPPVTSGLAIGSLVTGVASILVSLLVLCFGIAGPDYGGAWAAGAFTVLGALAGVGAIVAWLLARRQIRRPAPPPAVRFTGGGLAVAGLSCGAVGLLLSVLGLGIALVVQIT